MEKKLFSWLLLFTNLLHITYSIKIVCEIKTYDFWGVGSIEYCNGNNDLNIISLNDRKIDEVSGHKSVKGLAISNKKFKYFPLNLEKYFTNLEALQLPDGKLVEIRQNDLKELKFLKHLYLSDNDIEYLEKDLLVFNSQLIAVFFQRNKISNIHSKVFDNLNNLRYLYLSSNLCLQKDIKDNRTAVLSLINDAKLYCKSLTEINEENSVTCLNEDMNYVKIDCKFSLVGFNDDHFYACTLDTSMNILKPNTMIYRMTGIKNSSDVMGFSSEKSDQLYFPKYLHKFFTNLVAIRFKNGRLKEIHQTDLKSFNKLVYLNLDENDIEVLETDLFKYNPELKLIWIEYNKLKSVDVASMRDLNKLKDLDLRPNCITSYITTQNEIASGLNKIALNCPYPPEKITNMTWEKQLKDEKNSMMSQFDDEKKLILTKFNDEKKDMMRKVDHEKQSMLSQCSNEKKSMLSQFDDEKKKTAVNFNNEKRIMISQFDHEKKSMLSQFDDEKKINLAKFDDEKRNILSKCEGDKLNISSKFNQEKKIMLRKFDDENQKIAVKFNDEKNKILSNCDDEKMNISSKFDDEELTDDDDETMINQIILFFVAPLLCLITLINIAVYISCCMRENIEEQEIIEDQENIEPQEEEVEIRGRATVEQEEEESPYYEIVG